MFQLIESTFTITRWHYSLSSAYILNKYHLSMKRDICSRKEEPFVPVSSEFTQEKSHLLNWIKSLEPLCFWRKPVICCLPNKYGNKHSSSGGPYCILVCVHDHSISEYSFTNHTYPSLWTGMWLCPPESPATTHKLLEKLIRKTGFFSSPFTNFVPKVAGLKSISWRHQDQHLAKTLLEVSSQILACKGEDFP